MAQQLQMLALSPTMEKGAITKWLKKVGDQVNQGDVICEVETDKATMDYECPEEGTLLKIVTNEGDQAAVGDVIAIIGQQGEDISSMEPQKQQSQPEQKPEPEQEKQQQQEVPETQHQAAKTMEKQAQQKRQEVPPEKEETKTQVKSTPLARKLAKERGMDLSQLQGTGPAGRVVVRDIEQAIEDQTEKKPASRQTQPKQKLEDQQIPISPMRKVIAERLSQSMFTAPHYYLKVAVNAQELITTRQKLKLDPSRKVSYNSFLIKLSAEAIKHHPMINSSWAQDKIIKHSSIDIGLAVAIENGLITPVVRDCGNKGIMEIEKEMTDLIELAKKGQLKKDQYEGATFTISNLGHYGIDEFTAIINPPASTILAVGMIANQPVVDDSGNIVPKPIMKLTLGCDHRIIDGAVGAAFLNDLKNFIEEPISAFY